MRGGELCFGEVAGKARILKIDEGSAEEDGLAEALVA
jgi:hypothetical protein